MSIVSKVSIEVRIRDIRVDETRGGERAEGDNYYSSYGNDSFHNLL